MTQTEPKTNKSLFPSLSPHYRRVIWYIVPRRPSAHRSPRLKLHHSFPFLSATQSRRRGKRGGEDLPSGALLVEDTVAALLATDGLAFIDPNLDAALSAEVVH